MTFKEVAHFYIGCELSTPYGICKFLFFKNGYDEKTYNPVVVDRGDNHFAFQWNEVRPILRSIEDATEQEISLFSLTKSYYPGCTVWYTNAANDDYTPFTGVCIYPSEAAEITLKLCAAGFDLFELIESGEAIKKQL